MTSLSLPLLVEAKKRNKICEHEEEGIKYLRFREEFRSIPRGTVILKSKRIIWGYPHIKRIFTLEKGILKNIKSERFYIEEKIDGFNVRVARINGQIFAFSRGGFIDWFATEKVRAMGFQKFFEQNPDFVLCGEMIGNTPYTKPSNLFDVKFLVFDIDEGDGGYLRPRERYNIVKKYNLESVPVLGAYRKNDLAKIKQIVLMLLKKKREGIVIKSEDRSDLVKYVTPYADIDDLSRNIQFIFDMPSGFFIQRVLRSAFFIRDFELDQDDYARQLGRACYRSLIDKLKELERGGEVSENYEIVLKNPASWEKVLKHMSKEVRIEVLSKKEDAEGIRIKFKKVYKKSDRRLRSYLMGKGITD